MMKNSKPYSFHAKKCSDVAPIIDHFLYFNISQNATDAAAAACLYNLTYLEA